MSSSERQACGDALPYQTETTIPEYLLEYLGNNKPRLGEFWKREPAVGVFGERRVLCLLFFSCFGNPMDVSLGKTSRR